MKPPKVKSFGGFAVSGSSCSGCYSGCCFGSDSGCSSDCYSDSGSGCCSGSYSGYS